MDFVYISYLRIKWFSCFMSCVVYKLICLFYWSRDISYLNIKRIFCFVSYVAHVCIFVGLLSWDFWRKECLFHGYFILEVILIFIESVLRKWLLQRERWRVFDRSCLYGIVLKNGLSPDILFLWGGSAVIWPLSLEQLFHWFYWYDLYYVCVYWQRYPMSLCSKKPLK